MATGAVGTPIWAGPAADTSQQLQFLQLLRIPCLDLYKTVKKNVSHTRHLVVLSQTFFVGLNLTDIIDTTRISTFLHTLSLSLSGKLERVKKLKMKFKKYIFKFVSPFGVLINR